MILKLSQNSHNDEILNENKPANENWLGEMGKSSGTPTQTLYRWWDNFCKETGLTITPKQASDENRNAFFAWLDAQKQADEAEKARKQAEVEAEKKRKEQEAKARRMETPGPHARAGEPAFAAEVGRLIAKLSENCQTDVFANGKNEINGNWVDDLAKTSNTPAKTIYNWWSAFCKETGLTITRKQRSV